MILKKYNMNSTTFILPLGYKFSELHQRYIDLSMKHPYYAKCLLSEAFIITNPSRT